MKTLAIPALLIGLLVFPACSSGSFTQRDFECVGATMTGAVIGGAIGNQFGGGSGRDILTAGGAIAGGAVANNAAGC